MIEFSLLKQLKKKLRRRRRTLWVLGGIILMLAVSNIALDREAAAAVFEEEVNVLPVEQLDHMDGTLSVRQHITYICGKEEKLLGRMDTKDIADLLRQNPDWSAEWSDSGKSSITLKAQVADLSSYCKNNAYMGIDKLGNFSLFDGIPSDEKVLQTFFQLDMQYLESSLPKERIDELARGIRIIDIDSYNSVLSTFSDYALDRYDQMLRDMSGAGERR